MVAITVILAAVIGAFVLEIGDQQETAPNTSFDSEQRTVFIEDNNKDRSNTTEVDITHAGGTVVEISQVDVKVEGNNSVWGQDPQDNNGWEDADIDCAEPKPDHTEGYGSNEAIEFTSGQTWSLVTYGYHPDAYINPNEDCDWGTDPTTYALFPHGSTSESISMYGNSGPNGDPNYRYQNFETERLLTDDSINVVWTASSGGKTQTLFKYSVQ
jgi:FlaG/FlaF family flagellin (archaellin)